MKQKFFKKKALVLGALSALLLNPSVQEVQAGKDFSLSGLQKDIESRYKGVAHISGEKLAQTIKTHPESVVIFDVREPAEYNVSHIPGAVQVAPNIWHTPFMRKYASQVKGKKVVVYCSVGVRSSKLAAYVQNGLKKAGATSVSNLQYGVFGWANEGRPLVDNVTETKSVHPYDRHWGQLVKNSSLRRYKPEHTKH